MLHFTQKYPTFRLFCFPWKEEMGMDEERLIEEVEQRRKKRTRLLVKKHTSFHCSFCGNYTTDSNEYYSNLTNILLTRFINLFKPSNDQNYSEGVMDCIHAVWGGHNSVMRRALEVAGYLDAFEQKHGKIDEDLEHKHKCEHCDQWKWEWQLTIDESKVAMLICEGCLSKKKDKKGNK